MNIETIWKGLSDEQVALGLREKIQAILMQAFGYCGVVENITPEGGGFLLLNSGKGNIKVQITWEKVPK